MVQILLSSVSLNIIEEIQDSDNSETINSVSNDCGDIKVPDHLQDLWKRGSENISQAESKKLAELLTKY